MERLKHLIIYLIFALTFFFNIERLDIYQENLVNIHTFVYVLAVVAIFSIITFPTFTRFSAVPSVITWLIFYFLFHLILFKGQELFNNIYITITEIFMLIIITVLTYQVAQALREFRQAVESVSTHHLRGAALLLEEANDFIRKEMRRSRQFQRSLSVIVATPDFQSLQAPLSPLVQEAQNSIAHRFARAKLAKIISDEVQLVNTVLEDTENGRFIIVCPEIDEQDASLLAERISRMIKHNLDIDARCGIASFPDKALTFEELVAQAEKSGTLTNPLLFSDKQQVPSHS